MLRNLFINYRIDKSEPVADINSTGIENRTALHCAIYEDKLEAAKLLIQHGANIEAKTIHGRTPLHIACILGEESLCSMLLDEKCSVNSQDFEKNTPVHYASFYSKVHTNQ